MHIDLLPEEQWESLNKKVMEQLKLTPEIQLRVSKGLATSVNEVVAGIAQFYSHKRSAVFIHGVTHAFQAVLPSLYKEGFQMQVIRSSEMATPTWIENLKKDTSFVLMAEDHPITGEILPWEEIDKKLNDLKIFSIRVSHTLHLKNRAEPLPYSVRICSLDPHLSLIVAGNKFRAPVLTLAKEFWPVEVLADEVQGYYQGFAENQSLIENFESHLPQGFQALTQNKNRIFDRALIYHSELNGEAMQACLAKKLQWMLKSPGWETRVETTSLCRWGGVSLYEDWWDPKPSPEILRSLLIINAGHLSLINSQSLIDMALECRI